MLERLLAANPESVAAARDVMVSHYMLGLFYQQAGKPEIGITHLSECHRMLHELHEAGCSFDPQMKQVYQHLHAQFGEGGTPASPPPAVHIPDPLAQPAREVSLEELRASAGRLFQRGLWEAATGDLQKLLARGEPLSAHGPQLITCLLNAHEDLLPGDAARIESLLTQLEAAGHAALVAPLRQQFTAKRAPAKKPWWKVW